MCILTSFSTLFSPSSLEDEIPKIVEETSEIWLQVGDQYLHEEASRDKRVKEQMDFPFEQPEHYPKKGNE